MAVGLAGVLCSGCLLVRWAPQAAWGQWQLIRDRQALGAVVRNPETPAGTRALLAEVPKVKSWGQRHGLKPTGNYQHYVDVGRPAVVWVVMAAPPLSLTPVTWRFPVVGRVPYLGWFTREAALDHATALAVEGNDVAVRGVEAYSTLGWLPDPVLSTMLGPGDETARAGLINTVLHESVHATVFVADQAPFNEGLASFVGDALTERYLANEPRARDTWKHAGQTWERKRAQLVEAHARLKALYAAARTRDQKLRAKRVLLDALDQSVPLRSGGWNNATLSQFATYEDNRQAFAALATRCGPEPAAWLAAAAHVRAAEFTQSNQTRLEEVVDRLSQHCPAAQKASPL